MSHGTLAARLADVPHLDTALAPRSDVGRDVSDVDGPPHLSMVQGVGLDGVGWAARALWGVRGTVGRVPVPTPLERDI